jgi:AraC-like DNA-binding protein
MYEKFRLESVERADGPELIAYWAQGILPLAETDWHSHVRGQFFYVESGLFVVRTKNGSWMLPPHRAGWMPPGEMHTISISKGSSGWGAFIAPGAACGDLPKQTCVLGANDLIRALVLRASGWALENQLDEAQERVLAVLLDEIRRAPVESLHLPMPTDARLARIARALLEQPDDNRGMDEWAHWAGLSPRTMSRLFRQETSCSFAQWRQQAKLTHAMERLAGGEAVAAVADALGYAGPSAFVAMFRRAFGQSPARYFAGRRPLSRLTA